MFKVGHLSVVRFFVSETTESVSRQLFADSQKHIFIIDGQSTPLLHNFNKSRYILLSFGVQNAEETAELIMW